MKVTQLKKLFENYPDCESIVDFYQQKINDKNKMLSASSKYTDMVIEKLKIEEKKNIELVKLVETYRALHYNTKP